MADRLTTLRDLHARVCEAGGPDRELDAAILVALGELPSDGKWLDGEGFRSWSRGSINWHHTPYLTASLYAAAALIGRSLPGFWWTAGLCDLSGHASIGPDYNGPHGERLRREWPEEKFHAGFDADLTPGDGPHRVCLALLSCLLAALIAKEQADDGPGAPSDD